MLASMRARFPAAAKAVPGLAAAAGVAGAATVVAAALPTQLHISAIPVSIVLGSALANVGPLAQHMDMMKPGLKVATSTILRTGISLGPRADVTRA